MPEGWTFPVDSMQCRGVNSSGATSKCKPTAYLGVTSITRSSIFLNERKPRRRSSGLQEIQSVRIANGECRYCHLQGHTTHPSRMVGLIRQVHHLFVNLLSRTGQINSLYLNRNAQNRVR